MLGMTFLLLVATRRQSKVQFNVLIAEEDRWEARCQAMEDGIALILNLIRME